MQRWVVFLEDQVTKSLLTPVKPRGCYPALAQACKSEVPTCGQHRALHSSGGAGVGSCASFTVSQPPIFLMLGREDSEGQDACLLSTASSHEPFEIVAHELDAVHGLGQNLLV